MAMAKEGRAKELTPVKATTITIAGETRPALTAASPITKAPTMLTACPTGRGNLTPASRKTSKIISRMKASTTAGKGIPSR